MSPITLPGSTGDPRLPPLIAHGEFSLSVILRRRRRSLSRRAAGRGTPRYPPLAHQKQQHYHLSSLFRGAWSVCSIRSRETWIPSHSMKRYEKRRKILFREKRETRCARSVRRERRRDREDLWVLVSFLYRAGSLSFFPSPASSISAWANNDLLFPPRVQPQ